MKKLPWLFGNALAGYLDFCIGVLIATLVSLLFGVEPAWPVLLTGGLLALLPDTDIVVPILTFRSAKGHRETLFHRPLFVLPLVTATAWLVGGAYGAVLALTCVFWHYLHDTRGLSEGGIAWAWPFSKKYLSPFSSKPIVEEPHEVWLKKHWLGFSTLAKREIGIGTIALIVAIFIAWQ